MPSDTIDPAAPHEPVLSVRDLRASIAGRTVLRGVDLTVNRSGVLAVIGPSGSGKTTLLRCLNGLHVAHSGRITAGSGLDVRFDDAAGRRDAQRLRHRSAMVFQHHNLFPHMTAMQNVCVGPVSVQRRATDLVEREAQTLLDRFGIGDRGSSYPNELSGGQQQRVGLARALALRPDLLLVDEPTSALDPELVGDVLQLMSELAAEGWTMVVVTHELAFAADVADHIAFLHEGRVLEEGPPGAVLRSPAHERTRQFVARLAP